MEIIRATSDIFFKFLFGKEENKDLLLSFINAVHGDSGFALIKTVEIKNPFNIKNFSIDKESIVDVKATDENGRVYDIEVQTSGNDIFKNRTLYYWAKLYSSQLKEANLFSKLKPTICINVIDFDLFKEYDYPHSCFLLKEMNNPEFVLTDHLMIHFVELKKIEKKRKEIKKDLLDWSLFLENEGVKEDEMTILLKDNEILKKAHNEYKKFTEDEELRDLALRREMFKMDHETQLDEAKKEGELLEKQNVLVKLITKKFGITDNEKELIKKTTNLEKLDIAIEDILFIDNKDEILNKLR